MTIDATTPAQLHPIAGTGPYGSLWPYAEGSITASIVQADSTLLTLTPITDFTVSPLSTDTAGNVTLSAGIAATHAGRQLFLQRVTLDEQGWLGNLSAREKGLETQLDGIVMGLQEVRAGLGRALRTTAAMAAFAAGVTGTTLMWSDGQIVPGPTGAAIIAAEANATAAALAAATAQAQAALLAGVQAYGALGNGATNDQAAIVAALAATTGPVLVPWTASFYPVTALTADQIARLYGPGQIRIGASRVWISSIPMASDDSVSPLRVINDNLTPSQWFAIDGSVHDGLVSVRGTRTGGYGSYGLNTTDYQTQGFATPSGQFDVASTTWFSSGGLASGSGFSGWMGANTPSLALGHTFTGGSIVGLEINVGNRFGTEAHKADLTGVRDTVGLKIVPDVVPSRQGATVAIYDVDFGWAVGQSIHGHQFNTGGLIGVDAISPGGVAFRVRGASTAPNAPSHLWLTDGFYTNGIVLGGTFTDGFVVSGTGTRGINMSAATLASAAIRLGADHQISWGGAAIFGGTNGLSLSLGNGGSISVANDGHLYTADFVRRAMRWGDDGTNSAIGFLGAVPATRITLPAAATDAATTQALVNAIRILLITFGLAA